jgi:hypothetical protein
LAASGLAKAPALDTIASDAGDGRRQASEIASRERSRRMTRQLILVLLVAGLTCVLVVGCGSKVSKGNYDKISNGMTVAEVEGIMGKGAEEAAGAGAIGNLAGSAKVMSWKDGDKTITVTFVNDKVTAKIQKGL